MWHFSNMMACTRTFDKGVSILQLDGGIHMWAKASSI